MPRQVHGVDKNEIFVLVDKTEKVESKRGKRYFTFFRRFRGKFRGYKKKFREYKNLKNFAGINFREPKHYDFAGINFRERPKNPRNRESLYGRKTFYQ